MEKTIEMINKCAAKFLMPLSLEDTYKTIVKEAVRINKASYGSILLSTEKGELKRVFASKQIAYQTINRKKANTYKCFKQRKTLIVSISDLSNHHPELQKNGIKWTIFIPLFYQKKSIGVMTVNTKNPESINKKDINTLNLFGMFATLAILNAGSRDQIKRTLESRDLFIALASHEIKTPLTAIYGYIQLLNRKISNPDDPQYKWVISLKSEISRLIDLVKELLEIDQIKTGSFSYIWAPTDLNEIINQSILDFKLITPDRKINYTNKLKNKSGIIVADKNKLLQVILNIIHNAIKYSEQEIEISLDSDSDNYIISIKDKGIGIVELDKKKIFNDFYKGTNSDKEGLGLGLFLTKHIIDSHSGTIEVDSEKDVGTTIIVSIPIEQNHGTTITSITATADARN